MRDLVWRFVNGVILQRGITAPVYLGFEVVLICWWCHSLSLFLIFFLSRPILFCVVQSMERWICLLRWWLVSSWTGTSRTWRVKCVSNTFSIPHSFLSIIPPISLNCSTLSSESPSVWVPIPALAAVFSACPSLMRDGPHLVEAASQRTWLAIKHWEDHPPLNCSVDQC